MYEQQKQQSNMDRTTLTEIIDDILLLVRNNNISESEDLSRAQIAAWVNHYRRYFWKLRKDELKDKIKSTYPTIEELMSLVDDEFFFVKETGPMKLETVEDDANTPTRRTVDKLDGLLDNDWKSVLAVHDVDGENIQYINHIRRHYNKYRKYTFAELSAYYLDDGHVYIQGWQDDLNLEYIYVLGLYEKDNDEDDDEESEDPDEDSVKIPTWLVPRIKDAIMKNELSFMLNRPSDDSNNATLASVKPHGPQDQEE